MLYNDKFILDGVHYNETPSGWQPDFAGFVKRTRNWSIGNKPVDVILRQPNVTDEVSVTNWNKGFHIVTNRRNRYQAEWNNEGWMQVDMYNHLRSLYYNRKPFWIRFDAEMSRCQVQLYCVDTSYEFYVAPTNPIFPYAFRTISLDTLDYTSDVFINDVSVATLGIDMDVYPDAGIVRFPTTQPISTDIVSMRYIWRAFVTISDLSLSPIPGEPATNYVGNVVFQQVRNEVDYTDYPDSTDRWVPDYVAPTGENWDTI